MWYFAWILGFPLAALFAIVNAMWLEMRSDRELYEPTTRISDSSRD